MFKFKMRVKGFRGGEAGSTERTGEGFKRVKGGSTFKEVIEMGEGQLRERVNTRFDRVEVLMEGLKEEVIFDFETLEELLIEEDMIGGLMEEDMMDIIDNTRCEEEEVRIELVIREEDEDTFILDIDFEMFTISDTAEGITEDTGGIINLAVIVEFVEVGFANIRGFTMFRVDKNGRESITGDLDIAGVMLVTGEENIGIGESFKKEMEEDIFGHLSFKRGITSEVVMKRGESIMDGGDFMMDSMRVEGSGDIFKKIRLEIRERD